ncbi:serine threonine protein kinase cki3, partial [Nannochloropsis gaditana CCMP526]
LSQLFESQGRYFSPATLADYGKQMLDGIQQMHERQLLFIDVKPENFMLGLPGTRASKRVFLVDLGLVEKYTGSNGVHKPQE